MEILVIGANGQIGKQVVQILKQEGKHEVKAMVRNENQIEEFESMGIKAVLADLEDSVEFLSEVFKGCDAIIFAAGSGGSTGPDKTLLVDLDGAVKTMEAAQEAEVERYIMVSALQANNRENWNPVLKPYYVAKHYADRILEQSELNYTIVRPGRLLNEAGTGKIKAGIELERSSIPREDVARTLVAAIDNHHTFRKSFDLTSGELDIKIALKKL
ncbi:SDR family oxidoreductase [Echinicola jeungdonensis]|uniref:SDR family oxidoreductase n=1 Tax=Echinicola jeungdonensis TaxID=709343 RepID=A0ABV5J949_9BACT|nr:SDR family oxidoreductase [Echinicola jeungdonensis]MDN3670544.1 SDR family oxidoreductase [Echinicola jeungdonensis]